MHQTHQEHAHDRPHRHHYDADMLDVEEAPERILAYFKPLPSADVPSPAPPGHVPRQPVGDPTTTPTHTPPYPQPNNPAPNRMSAKARDGVVNKWGQSHDIDNLFISDGSVFTTGASENPTLTIVTLAIRQADYIAEQMGKNNI